MPASLLGKQHCLLIRRELSSQITQAIKAEGLNAKTGRQSTRCHPSANRDLFRGRLDLFSIDALVDGSVDSECPLR